MFKCIKCFPRATEPKNVVKWTRGVGFFVDVGISRIHFRDRLAFAHVNNIQRCFQRWASRLMRAPSAIVAHFSGGDKTKNEEPVKLEASNGRHVFILIRTFAFFVCWIWSKRRRRECCIKHRNTAHLHALNWNGNRAQLLCFRFSATREQQQNVVNGNARIAKYFQEAGSPQEAEDGHTPARSITTSKSVAQLCRQTTTAATATCSVRGNSHANNNINGNEHKQSSQRIQANGDYKNLIKLMVETCQEPTSVYTGHGRILLLLSYIVFVPHKLAYYYVETSPAPTRCTQVRDIAVQCTNWTTFFYLFSLLLCVVPRTHSVVVSWLINRHPRSPARLSLLHPLVIELFSVTFHAKQ